MTCPLCQKAIEAGTGLPVSTIGEYCDGYWLEVTLTACHEECYEKRKELLKCQIGSTDS